jgi:glycine dehydrogenase
VTWAADAAQAIACGAARWPGANLRLLPGAMRGLSLDETTTRDDVELLWRAFAKDGQALPHFDAFENGLAPP